MSVAVRPDTLWSKHRVEALTDGIFAVAMTLLVIELKVPDPHTLHTRAELGHALIALAPKAVSWVISFLVLAVFWISHHRLFHYVRCVDTGLLWRNLIQLGFVSLMPFSAALVGEFVSVPIAQVAYNGNMVMLGLLGLEKLRYLRTHPELAGHPMEPGTYHATLLRVGGLVVLGTVAIVIALTQGTVYATFVYLLMIPIGRYSRHIEAKGRTLARATDPSRPDLLPHDPP